MARPTGITAVPAWNYWAIFLGFVLFYVITMPVNHIESVDRHAYAMWAETLPLTRLIDTRSILFTVLNRSLYLLAQMLGTGLPATTIVTSYSVLAGAGACALMTRLLSRHFALQANSAVLGGILLGLSYGVWRYAMEVEVYVASIFLVLAALSFLLDRLDERILRPGRFIVPGLFAGLVVMFYQPNVFPLFLAIPVLFAARNRFLPFVTYGVAGTLGVILTYVVAFEFSRSEPLTISAFLAFVGSRNAEFTADPLNFTTLAKLVLAISHTLLSSNWIFGVQNLTEAFQNQFPATETDYKILSAVHFRPWVYLPLGLIPLIIGLGVAFFRSARSKSLRSNPRLMGYLLAWLVIYGVVAGRLDPGVSEVWIPIVPIWVMLFSALIIAPIARDSAEKYFFAFVVCIGFWNWFGGIGMLKNPEGDFLGRQSAWLQANATAQDQVILTDGTWKSGTYLEHVLPLDVLSIVPECLPGISASAAALADARAATAARHGRLFVFQTFIKPSPRLSHIAGCPARGDNAAALAEIVAPNIKQVTDNGIFSVYEILP